MKSFILLIIGITLCIENKNRNKQIVEIVNKMNTTWKAQYYERNFKPLIGLDPSFKDKNLKRKVFSKKINLPKEYDLRKVHPECETISEIRDQANCGACWAFCAAEVMSDRLCLKSKGKIQTRVSTQYVVSCCTRCGNGCLGGRPEQVFKYWEYNGVYYFI